MLTEEYLRDLIFFVLASKQDQDDAINPSLNADRIDLNEIVDRKYQIFGTSAKTGFRLNNAF